MRWWRKNRYLQIERHHQKIAHHRELLPPVIMRTIEEYEQVRGGEHFIEQQKSHSNLWRMTA